MNYTDVVNELSVLTNIPSTNAYFQTNLPTTLAYAEGRITRELDLMAANVRDSSSSTSALNRNFNLPTAIGTFLIIDGINIITPASTAPDSGVRNQLVPVSRDYLDFTWSSTTNAGLPQYFSYLSQDTYSSPTQTQVIFGPWPDSTYRVEIIGKVQPAGLSATNTTTWLSVNLPELYIAACMVWMSGYQQNFGKQGLDNPDMSVSWESQYRALRDSASTYEARKRFSGASWSSKQVEATAQPQRG